MKNDGRHFLIIKNKKEKTIASFRNHNRLTILNSEAIRLGLLDIVTHKDVELEIDLRGIRFMDSAVIDIFNLLSRLAKKYESRVLLTNVESELMELIELVKLHSVFDIKDVIPRILNKSVA